MKKNCNIIITIILALFLFSPLRGQNKIGGETMQYIVENGDTVFISSLPPAYKYYVPKKGEVPRKEWRKYYKTVHNFAKTYQYALLAREEMDAADKYLAEHELSARERDKYLKGVEKELIKKFETPLRNLTFSQGRMLLKLIDRELGMTSFYIIKDYIGGAAAGFWQGIAKIFGADLKKPYDKFGEDKLLEELVFIYQNGDFASLYVSIFRKYPPKPAYLPKNDYPQNIYYRNTW